MTRYGSREGSAVMGPRVRRAGRTNNPCQTRKEGRPLGGVPIFAAELVLSSDTVRTHVSRAVSTPRRDRAQLVVFAIQAGLTAGDTT